jgi:crotonobetainyl-CoA:carnitine CoA-transferase CaiB-like acyl-CoA transferase
MLAGLRIVDTSRLIPGPFATWLLAQMGADVIKVEQPGVGDYLRSAPGAAGGTLFEAYNTGKRSVALNLRHQAGRDAFLDLVTSAAAVLDGNRPGVLDRLGCGWDECRRRNPALVFCALTGFGQTGPYRNRAGHDANYLAYSGLLSAVQDADGRPVLPDVNIADMTGALLAAIGLLAAVMEARATGRGRFVDAAMLDAVVSIQGRRIIEQISPPPTARAGSGTGDTWESGLWQTSDGRWISLDPYEPKFKGALWDLIERETGRARPPDTVGRDAVRAALAAAIMTRTLAQWDAALSGTEVCYAPVLSLAEALNDPQVSERQAVMADAERGFLACLPLRFLPPLEIREAAAPRLGEHTSEILSELGWTAERIAAAGRRDANASG